MTPVLLTAAALSLAAVFAQPAAAETAREVIAAHVRTEGHPCDQPKSATRLAKESRPHAAVWILVCANARYKVRLVPNMAAKIERLPDEDARPER